jgi:tetratricopeptide (TPR) repeat protein
MLNIHPIPRTRPLAPSTDHRPARKRTKYLLRDALRHHVADAWYNLSDLLDEQGRVEAAIECLRTVLRVAPDYADAMFNLALLLQRTNQYAEATDTGVAISPAIVNPNGPHGRADH